MTKEYAITDFSSIEIGNGFDVELNYGSEFKVEVDFNKSVEKRLIVEKEEDSLVLRLEKGFSFINNKLAARITLPAVNNLKLSGACTISIIGKVPFFDKTVIELSGASNIKGNINASLVEIYMSGASDMSIVGSATEVIATLSGASSINSIDFTTDLLEANLSGASSIKLECLDLIQAKLSGASSIKYIGSPKTEIETSGGSTVKKIDGN